LPCNSTIKQLFYVKYGVKRLILHKTPCICQISLENNDFSGSCAEVLNTEGTPLSYVVYHPNKNALVIMMDGLTIGFFSVDRQGHLTEIAKVKLSGRIQTRGASSQGLTWAGSSSLAILTGLLTIFWL